MNGRFTLDGSPELERFLEEFCFQVERRLRTRLPENRFRGLLLGGGYGRGEGGVLRTEMGDQPYNDLEFYVFVPEPAWLNERRYRHTLHDLGQELTPQAGVDVEFKIISSEKIRKSPVTMFYYDLVEGHRWIAGNDQLLAGCEHHRLANRIPLSESSRLLMNRCSGLLFSLERLERESFTEVDADFVGRNLAKAQLAFGDVVLAAFGQYHWSCLKRNQRLDRFAPQEPLPWLEAIRKLHAKGVEFKLRPVRTSTGREDLREQHAELSGLGRELWLWLEGRRLARSFRSTRDYALDPNNKFPDLPAWRNRLIHAKAFGAGAACGPMTSRYPRERLCRSLPLLLWEPRPWDEADVLARLQSHLRTSERSLSGLVRAYETIWSQFN